MQKPVWFFEEYASRKVNQEISFQAVNLAVRLSCFDIFAKALCGCFPDKRNLYNGAVHTSEWTSKLSAQPRDLTNLEKLMSALHARYPKLSTEVLKRILMHHEKLCQVHVL